MLRGGQGGCRAPESTQGTGIDIALSPPPFPSLLPKPAYTHNPRTASPWPRAVEPAQPAWHHPGAPGDSHLTHSQRICGPAQAPSRLAQDFPQQPSATAGSHVPRLGVETCTAPSSPGCIGAANRRVGAFQSEGAADQGWSWPPRHLRLHCVARNAQDRAGQTRLSCSPGALRRDGKDSVRTW